MLPDTECCADTEQMTVVGVEKVRIQGILHDTIVMVSRMCRVSDVPGSEESPSYEY